jgi:hypothetical protein
LRPWLATHGVEVVEIEEVQPLHELLGVDGDVLNAAFEAADNDELVAVFYVPDDPSKWEEDPDADLLRVSAGRTDLVRFRYLGTDVEQAGFVIDVSDDWALIHRLDESTVELDGHTAVRLDQVIDVEVIEDDEFFARRALALRGEAAHSPSVAITDHAAILSCLRERFPLIRLSHEGDDGAYIGRIEEVAADSVVIGGVSQRGDWVGQECHDYRDIVAIGFGSKYDAALASVATRVPTTEA